MPRPPTNIITIYGRKPVLEALQDASLSFYKVHMADSNQRNGIIKDIEALCATRGVEVVMHDRLSLSRISKNRKQDQGIAADIIHTGAKSFDEDLATIAQAQGTLLALDGVTNPQNVGMIIRTVAASKLSGVLLPRKGCAKLDALVIKASAGCLFRCNIWFCDSLADTLAQANKAGITSYGMATGTESKSLFDVNIAQPAIIVLGGETDGLSAPVKSHCAQLLNIPMHNGVESLNVSTAAGIVAFNT